MAIKVLVLLSLIYMASASPTPTLSLPRPTINFGGVINIGSSDLGVGLGSLLKTIIGSKHLARKSLTTILALKIKDWNSLCYFSIRVLVSLCDTIEASYKGLGILISRLIICLLRIIICIYGKGGNNPICSDYVHTLVGVSAKGVLDEHGLIKAYDLWNVQAQLNAIINFYTKGLGISRCKGSTSFIFQIAVELAKIIQIIISGLGKLTKYHLTVCFKKIVLIIGVIGNSRRNGLGISIVKNYIPACNKYLKIAGYEEIDNPNELATAIDSCNGDNGPWAVSDEDDDKSSSVSVSVSIGALLKGLLGVTRLAVNLIKEIIGIVIKSAEDCYILIIKIVLALGGILDAACAGLGSLFARIIAGLLKILLCFVGSGKYGICKPGWDRQFQVHGDITSIELAIKAYGFGSIRLHVDTHINAYIKIRGKPTGSVKVFCDTCTVLGDICDSRKYDKTILRIIWKHVITLLGAVGNSNSKGVGTSVCNKLVPILNKYLANEGIKVEIDSPIVNSCNDDDYSWTSDIDTSDGKTGWIIDRNVAVSGGNSNKNQYSSKGFRSLIKKFIAIFKLSKPGARNAVIDDQINTLKDVFDFIFHLILVLQEVLNKFVYGLGTLLVRIVAFIIKIAVCIKGYPGDKGICTKDWNNNYGGDGDGSTITELIVVFRLNRVLEEYNGYVHRCTGGKGISSTHGSIRSVLQFIRLLIEIALNAEKISKDSVTNVFIYVTNIIACIGNSKERNSGTEFIRYIYPKCGIYFKDSSYIDITTTITVAETECAKSNDDGCDWDGGDNSTPRPGGGNTTPSGGHKTTPSHGGHTTPSSGGYTTSSGYTTTSGDTGTTPGYITGTTPGHITVTTPTPAITTVSGGYTTTSSHGGGTTPYGGHKTTPSSGGDTTPYGGNKTTPSPGGGTTPYGGHKTTPSPGGDTTPYGGHKTTPSPGGYTVPCGCHRTTPSPGGHTTTPSPGGYTTPYGGHKTTPSSGGDTTPYGGHKTTPSPGGDTTPYGGHKTTPSPGGYTAPCGCHRTTPSPGGHTTTPSPGGYTTPYGGHKTTPSSGGDTTPYGGHKTTPSPGGDTTPYGGHKTTPSPGGDTTPYGGHKTTPSPGGDTTPYGGHKTTPSPGGGTTPYGGHKTTLSPGGDTTPHGGYKTTPSPGGDTTPYGGHKTTPSGGHTTTPSPGGYTTHSGGDNTDDCGIIIGGAIKDIPGSIRLSTTILIKQIIQIKIFGIIDIVNLIVKLAIALGGILDLIFTGLGSIFVRIVAVIFKIGCCVHGWGPRSICNREWNSQFGVYGDCSNEKDIKDLFRLTNLTVTTTIIKNLSGGKDIFKQNDFYSVILQHITLLLRIISSKTITKQHWSASAIHVLTIFGCISNSYSKGSGTVIIQKVITIFGPYFVQQGCPDIREEKTRVITIITVGNNAQIDWKSIRTKSDSGDLSTDVKDAFKEVKGTNDKAAYKAVFNLGIPRSFNGLLSFLIKVIRALGAILDFFIHGLGSLLVRIVGCLINYIIAILDRSRHADSFVCQKAYYDSFGVNVTGTTWVDLVDGFGIENCRSDLDAIKAAYIKLKGTLNVVENLFFQCGYNLILIVYKGSKIVLEDLSVLIRILIKLLCGFANSCLPHLGKKICRSFIPVCSSHLVEYKYPAITNESEDIYKSIDACNNVPVSWVTKTTVVVSH